jgi:hypothetical protein
MAVILKGSAAQILFVNAVATGTHNLTSLWQSGHPGLSYDQVDVVTFGDNGHRNNQGLQDASLDFTFLHSSGATESYSVFASLFAAASARNIVYAPNGTASGNPKWQIPARMFSFEPDGGPGEAAVINVGFAIDGTATIATW